MGGTGLEPCSWFTRAPAAARSTRHEWTRYGRHVPVRQSVDAVPELPPLPSPPPASSLGVRAAMQGNKRKNTRPERALRSALHRRGARFRVDTAPESEIHCRPDVVFHRARLVVFVDGCFWHGCPEHGTQPATNSAYWSAKISRNTARDRMNDSALETRGWTVMRVWEHEPPDEAATRILSVLSRATENARDRPSTAAPPRSRRAPASA